MHLYLATVDTLGLLFGGAAVSSFSVGISEAYYTASSILPILRCWSNVRFMHVGGGQAQALTRCFAKHPNVASLQAHAHTNDALNLTLEPTRYHPLHGHHILCGKVVFLASEVTLTTWPKEENKSH